MNNCVCTFKPLPNYFYLVFLWEKNHRIYLQVVFEVQIILVKHNLHDILNKLNFEMI